MIEALESARIVAQIDDRFKKIEKRLEETSVNLYAVVNAHERRIYQVERRLHELEKKGKDE